LIDWGIISQLKQMKLIQNKQHRLRERH